MAADIFKILSRSTKLSKGNRNAPKTFPSSGEPAHPQIYGHTADFVQLDEDVVRHSDNATASKSRKRKRGQAGHGASETLPPELDFFGNHAQGLLKTSEEAKRQYDNSNGPKNTALEEDGEDGASQALDEGESRRILREHKVKITVLEDWAFEDSKVPKRSHSNGKKHLKSEFVEDVSKKRKKQQIYPNPLLSFRSLRPRYRISQRLLENIDAQGYTAPTEVQMAAIPLLLDSPTAYPDLLSIAPTGSGKTLAFLIPTMDAILRIKRISKESADGVEPTVTDDAEAGPLAVVVAPTKELASQITNEARKLAKGTGIKVALFKKGMEITDRSTDQASLVEDLAEGDSLMSGHIEGDEQELNRSLTLSSAQRVKAHIIICTPLALIHALSRSDGASLSPLPTVQHLILDEADVLLDPLFREQVLSIWNSCSHLDLRISMWSATMASNIEALARDTIMSRHDSLRLSSESSSRPPLVRLVIGLKDTALPTILHKLVFAATEAGKLMALRQLLHPTAPSVKTSKDSLLGGGDDLPLHPPFLVFTQTIPRAVALAAELKYDIPPSAGGDTRIAALHADMSDKARDAVMTGFRRGEIWVLITTDLLARGVDFRGVNGVVNYDVPTSAASYVHRAGRTGRAGREGGIAVTLYAEEDVPFMKPIANVVAASSKERGGDGAGGLQQWLLKSLPTPTKREKKALKRRGIEARRPGQEKARISTKSGLERRVERRRRDAKDAVRKRLQNIRSERHGDSDSGFEGFED